jgi:DNA replication and repair protein RecF
MVGLTRLSLTEFRNYPSLLLKCDRRSVVLTGPNGAGKTNILEAISFLSPGRGLRRAKLSEVTRLESQEKGRGWGVAGTLTGSDECVDIGTALEVQEGKERRLVKVGSHLLKSQTMLSDYMHVLWLTPQMDRLLQEGGGLRRRFLDRLVYGFDAAHAARVTRYEYCMRERSRLLKYGSRDKYWFEALEDKISAEGVAITAARLQLIEKLAQASAWALEAFPFAKLFLTGQIESWLENNSALETEDKFREALKFSRQQDKESGSALYGPHRSEFKVIYVKKNCEAALCSTGEQKALLISILFAAARLQSLQRKGVPLILLDEIVAHLDEKKRSILFEEILLLNIQAWMTGTDPFLFKSFNKKVQHFQVENAVIYSADIS